MGPARFTKTNKNMNTHGMSQLNGIVTKAYESTENKPDENKIRQIAIRQSLDSSLLQSGDLSPISSVQTHTFQSPKARRQEMEETILKERNYRSLRESYNQQ